MHTRRHVLTSIPALALAPVAVLASGRNELQHHIDEIVSIARERDGTDWTAHVELDFILLCRKL